MTICRFAWKILTGKNPCFVVWVSSFDNCLASPNGRSRVNFSFLCRCSCECCQILDREAECICCQEVEQIVHKNNEVFLEENPPQNPPNLRSYRCITDNPGFQAVCLNRWVLQVAWFQYKQQYGNTAYEGPEHKILRHTAYRQLVRWCWGVLGKDIRVVLPSCAVSCIRAHFPPPGDEENFEFVGFLCADEWVIVGVRTWGMSVKSNNIRQTKPYQQIIKPCQTIDLWQTWPSLEQH